MRLLKSPLCSDCQKPMFFKETNLNVVCAGSQVFHSDLWGCDTCNKEQEFTFTPIGLVFGQSRDLRL